MPKGGFFGSNFDHIMREISPEALAGLLSDALFFNRCNYCCTQKDIYPCDSQCYKHILEWLDDHFDDAGKELIKAFKTWEEINE